MQKDSEIEGPPGPCSCSSGEPMACDEDQPLKAPEAAAARGDAREVEDQAARLPGDVLVDILSRVQPRWLAASRCVCKYWRDTVDGRRLLRADLLPLSLAGLFVHFNEHKLPEFLARPSSEVSGNLSFLPSADPHCGYQGCVDFEDFNIQDHCNGLLLLQNNCVVNPATRRWNTLPTCPAEHDVGNVDYSVHLVYDPMVSPYYEVFKIPSPGDYHSGEEVDPSMEESEWPPSLCKMFVFSSKSGCWEEKDFVREGNGAGTVGEMRAVYCEFRAAYFRGALYVHCETDFLMRVSLSTNTYNVIKSPMGINAKDYPELIIARSEKGVYFLALDTLPPPEDKCRLRVWILNESCGQTKWMLKHDKDLKHTLPRQCFCRRDKWVLEDINYNLFRASRFPEVNKKTAAEKQLEINSNDDSAINYGGMMEECYRDEEDYDDLCGEDIDLLGIHPYEEIVFLGVSQQKCLAYHLNDSKIEELGYMYPRDYLYFKMLGNERECIECVPYTPCWIEEFPGNN